MLTGPWQGRRQQVSRLGGEANDPIDELLNAASAYATSNVPSLVGFLAWFDAGEGELKREAGQAGGLVRVMTVHGSKGLQAPIVILADATDDPKPRRVNFDLSAAGWDKLPVFSLAPEVYSIQVIESSNSLPIKIKPETRI